jgi:hypothetical protein
MSSSRLTDGQLGQVALQIGQVMTPQALRAFLVIGLDREEEPVSTITDAVEQQGIPIEVIGRRRHFRRVHSVVVRVPQHRVAEAILALELRGFSDVVAYHARED